MERGTRGTFFPSTCLCKFFAPSNLSASAPMPTRPRRPLAPPKRRPRGQMKALALRCRRRRPQPAAPARIFYYRVSILKVEKTRNRPPRRRLSDSHRARAAHTMILATLGTGAATGPLVHAPVPRRASKVFFQWKSIQSFVQVIPNKSCTDVRIFLEIFYGTFRGPGSVRRRPAREP